MKTHGHCTGYKTSPTYKSWYSMNARCFKPYTNSYKHYGGRGITVCKRWEKFEHFLEDMGRRPGGMTLDRIDSNGNYEKRNCRWTTPKDNARNRTNNRIIICFGKKTILAKAAELINVKDDTISKRLDAMGDRWFDISKIKWRRSKVLTKEEVDNIFNAPIGAVAARQFGISETQVYRIKNGYQPTTQI